MPEYVVDANWTESRGYAGMLRLLSLEHPPTAVFCCNYNMAVGALALLKEHGSPHSGRHLAGQLRRRAAVQLHEAGITAVAQPIDKIAETITGLITSRLSEERTWHAPHTITLDCDIILRGSTRKPVEPRS